MTNAPIEKVQEAYDLMYDLDTSVPDIARKLDVSVNTINLWWDNPQKYSPFIDWVAVGRAAEGELSVYDALTVFEEVEFWKQVEQRVAITDLVSPGGDDGAPYNPCLRNLAEGFGWTARNLQDRRTAAIRRALREAQPRTMKIRLTEQDVRDIREANAAGVSQRKLAEQYKIGRPTISRLIRRETWTHVD